MRYLVPILALLPLAVPAGEACTLSSRSPDCAMAPQLARLAPEPLAPEAPSEPSGPILTPGDILPDRAMAFINTEYHGLPPAADGWWYFEEDKQIYRANPQSRQVLERVTHLANGTY